MQALLLADNPNIAVQILGLLKEAHCTVREAESIDELLALQRALPAGMLVLQGRAATPSAADTIAQIRKDCHSKQIPLPLILAYTSDESTWRSLAKAGFTHALSLPVERNSFLGTVKDALEMMEQHRNSSHPVELTQSMKVEEKIPDLFGPSSSQTVIQNSGLNIDLSPSLAEPSSSVNTSGNRGTSFQQPSLAAGFQQQPFVQLTPAETLSRASEKAVQGLEKGNMEQVEAFAKNIEETANSLSLTALARIAGLVRQAAKAKDTSAVQDLLPELSSVVERKIKELNLSL